MVSLKAHLEVLFLDSYNFSQNVYLVLSKMQNFPTKIHVNDCTKFIIHNYIYFYKKRSPLTHLRNQFKSMNTFEQSYDYKITLIRRGKNPLIISFLRIEWSLFGCFVPNWVGSGPVVLEKNMVKLG